MKLSPNIQNSKLRSWCYLFILVVSSHIKANDSFLKPKQHLNVIMPEYSTLSNPVTMDTSEARWLAGLTHRALLSIDRNNRIVPQLVTSVPTIGTKDLILVHKDAKLRLIVSLTLRSDIKWGNGTPISVADIIASWNLAKNSSLDGIFTNIADVSADSNNNQAFKITFVNSKLSNIVSLVEYYPIPHHRGIDKLSNIYNLNSTDVGLYSGPFLPVAYTPGKNITLKRNPHYTRIRPALDSIHVKLKFSKFSLKQAITEEKAHYVTRIPSTMLPTNHGLHIRQRQKPIVDYIVFNSLSKNVGNVHLRRWLITQIKRKQLQSIDPSLKTTNTGVLHIFKNFNRDKYNSTPKGLVLKNKRLMWQGKPLKIQIAVNKESNLRNLIALELRKHWQQLGIDVSIIKYHSKYFFSTVLGQEKFKDIAISSTTAGIKNSFYSMNGHLTTGFRNSNWLDKNFFDITTQLATEPIWFEQDTLLESAIRLNYQAAAVVPLFFRGYFELLAKNVNIPIGSLYRPSSCYSEYWSIKNHL